MATAVLGVIGGSGIYDLPGLERVREERVASPWGEPSAPLRIGEIAGSLFGTEDLQNAVKSFLEHGGPGHAEFHGR